MPGLVTGLPEKAHGFCYLANSAVLVFGHDRKEAARWRPVVSLMRTGLGPYVMPATTRYNKNFFHLRPQDCFWKRKHPACDKDSYLCPHYELVPEHALVEIGVVPQSVRLAIAAWLAKRESKD